MNKTKLLGIGILFLLSLVVVYAQVEIWGCGDTVCSPERGETYNNCPADCQAPPSQPPQQPPSQPEQPPANYCGDGQCTEEEYFGGSCLADCPAVPPQQPQEYCGNSVCNVNSGENVINCPDDCFEMISSCGNGVCGSGENQFNCPADCLKQYDCNYDGFCDGDTENRESCQDCEKFPTTCNECASNPEFCVWYSGGKAWDCKVSTVPKCNNGILDMNEVCDLDTRTQSMVYDNNYCPQKAGKERYCNPGCVCHYEDITPSYKGTCGDGIVQQNEACERPGQIIRVQGVERLCGDNCEFSPLCDNGELEGYESCEFIPRTTKEIFSPEYCPEEPGYQRYCKSSCQCGYEPLEATKRPVEKVMCQPQTAYTPLKLKGFNPEEQILIYNNKQQFVVKADKKGIIEDLDLEAGKWTVDSLSSTLPIVIPAGAPKLIWSKTQQPQGPIVCQPKVFVEKTLTLRFDNPDKLDKAQFTVESNGKILTFTATKNEEDYLVAKINKEELSGKPLQIEITGPYGDKLPVLLRQKGAEELLPSPEEELSLVEKIGLWIKSLFLGLFSPAQQLELTEEKLIEEKSRLESTPKINSLQAQKFCEEEYQKLKLLLKTDKQELQSRLKQTIESLKEFCPKEVEMLEKEE